jgi:hypothetical protein
MNIFSRVEKNGIILRKKISPYFCSVIKKVNSFTKNVKGSNKIKKKVMQMSMLVISEEITAKIKIVTKIVIINNIPIRTKLKSNIYYLFRLEL